MNEAKRVKRSIKINLADRVAVMEMAKRLYGTTTPIKDDHYGRSETRTAQGADTNRESRAASLGQMD